MLKKFFLCLKWLILICENEDYYYKIKNNRIGVSIYIYVYNICKYRFTHINNKRAVIINMSRDNTCPNKIKIGCDYRHSMACARTRFASDSTRLLLLAPKRKRSP